MNMKYQLSMESWIRTLHPHDLNKVSGSNFRVRIEENVQLKFPSTNFEYEDKHQKKAGEYNVRNMTP